MTTNVNLDLWHNAGYVLGILTEAMPVGEASLTRRGNMFCFECQAKIRGNWFCAKLDLTNRDLMDRDACCRIAIKAGWQWNEDVRRFHVDP